MHRRIDRHTPAVIALTFLWTRSGTTAEAVIVDTLRDLDVEALLRGAGLTHGDIEALRSRLVGT